MTCFRQKVEGFLKTCQLSKTCHFFNPPFLELWKTFTKDASQAWFLISIGDTTMETVSISHLTCSPTILKCTYTPSKQINLVQWICCCEGRRVKTVIRCRYYSNNSLVCSSLLYEFSFVLMYCLVPQMHFISQESLSHEKKIWAFFRVTELANSVPDTVQNLKMCKIWRNKEGEDVILEDLFKYPSTINFLQEVL